MKNRRSVRHNLPIAIILTALFALPVLAHHSFAMYDQTKTVTWTGLVTGFSGQANHAEIQFYVLGPDGKLIKEKDKDGKVIEGKYVRWGVEMAGAAAVAQQGITASSFGVGTLFSVKLNPMRDGTNFGSRVGAIAKCPMNEAGKPVAPEAGKHCDSVKGATILGGDRF